MFTLLNALAGLTDLEFHLVARLIGTCVCVHMQDSTVSKHPLLMLQIRYICIRYVRTYTQHLAQQSAEQDTIYATQTWNSCKPPYCGTTHRKRAPSLGRDWITDTAFLNFAST